MAQEKDAIALIAKTVVKHHASIHSLALLLGDAIHSIVASLKPCIFPQCKAPATVVHRTVGTAYCDHHVANVIVNAQRAKVWERGGALREEIINEDNWKDVHNAEAIRHIMEYVELTKEAEAQRYVPLH